MEEMLSLRASSLPYVGKRKTRVLLSIKEFKGLFPLVGKVWIIAKGALDQKGCKQLWLGP